MYRTRSENVAKKLAGFDILAHVITRPTLLPGIVSTEEGIHRHQKGLPPGLYSKFSFKVCS